MPLTLGREMIIRVTTMRTSTPLCSTSTPSGILPSPNWSGVRSTKPSSISMTAKSISCISTVITHTTRFATTMSCGYRRCLNMGSSSSTTSQCASADSVCIGFGARFLRNSHHSRSATVMASEYSGSDEISRKRLLRCCSSIRNRVRPRQFGSFSVFLGVEYQPTHGLRSGWLLLVWRLRSD